jgi:hypothetical protein
MRPWRRRKEAFGVFSLYAKRYKSVYISVNNNTNLNLFKILFNYIIWNRLSQKTISRYCPFNTACLLPACAILVCPLPLGVVSYYAGLTPCLLPACVILVFPLSLGVFSYYAGFHPPACFLPALFLSSHCLLAYYPTTQV